MEQGPHSAGVAENDSVHPMLCRVDAEGRVHPIADRAEWKTWMETHGKKLRVLVKSGTFAVGVRFIGEQQGWDTSGNAPLVWQAAVLAKKKSIATVHAKDLDQAFEIVERGMRKLLKRDGKALALVPRIRLSWLLWKMKWKRTRIKRQMLAKIQ